MIVKRIDPRLPTVQILLRQSDEYMASLYPEESNHLESVEDLCQPNVVLFGCLIEEELAGCGAVKLIEDDTQRYGEVKRLFVDMAYRRRGISTALLEALEQHLVSIGVETARLEVGIHQSEALRLYRQRGYSERGPFGDYRPDPLSLFMEKGLRG